MKSIKSELLGEQLRRAVNAILSISRHDLRRAIRKARTYLAWVRSFKSPDALAEDQQIAAIFTLNKLIAVLESRLPKKPR